MNTPSIELCKKLKEIGYPQKPGYVMEDRVCAGMRRKVMIDLHKPTVAEMIDALPETLGSEHYLRIERNPHLENFEYFCVGYATYDHWIEYVKSENLPNALAELRLLLKEKGFIN